MKCHLARELFLASLSREPGDYASRSGSTTRSAWSVGPSSGPCARRGGLFGRWPDAEPAPGIRARLVRQVRWLALRESLLTARGWTPAVLAGVIGVALSLGLSLLLPYPLLIFLCQQAFQVSDPHAGPYLIAGMVYGAPLAFGALVALRRPVTWGLIRGLEATVLFLLILAPYAIVQCREFPPALQVEFLSGMGIGALLGSVGGVWLGHQLPFSQRRT